MDLTKEEIYKATEYFEPPSQRCPSLVEPSEGWWWMRIHDYDNNEMAWCAAFVRLEESEFGGSAARLYISYLLPDGLSGKLRLTDINPANWGGRINPPNV